MTTPRYLYARTHRSMKAAFGPYCDDRLHPMPERSKLAEFFTVYREYRPHHSRRIAARIAYEIAFLGAPF